MNKAAIAIVGGGISGLSAGYLIKKKFGDRIELRIFEKSGRPGGTIGTTEKDGFLVDWGPNGFLDREPLTLELVRRIGLQDRLLRAGEEAKKRYIYRKKRLWEISPHPLKFMTSGVLSLKGRLRVAAEIFVPSKKDNKDESVFQFASRRIGREAAENLIDPMVSGIYGGNGRELSLQACFPVMEKMEREYGGLIKALVKKKNPSGNSGPAGPGGTLTSFKGGLHILIERLCDLLKDNIALECGVRAVEKDEHNRFVLHTSSGRHDFDFVILAVPSYVAADILRDLDGEVAGLMREIPYAGLAVVCQGYRLENIERPLDGFGFLVPHNQNMNILGSIWTSVIFPEQAPSGMALFRTMIGGAMNNEATSWSREKLSDISHAELSPILGLRTKPDYEDVFIWEAGIPQYVMGHPERVEKIESGLARMGRIYSAGNAYHGIGINDCVRRSFELVDALAAEAGIPA